MGCREAGNAKDASRSDRMHKRDEPGCRPDRLSRCGSGNGYVRLVHGVVPARDTLPAAPQRGIRSRQAAAEPVSRTAILP
jgi:hypothetical protein